MSHYAKIVDGIVTQVVVAEDDFFNSFVNETSDQWIQTSYNTKGGIYYGKNGPANEFGRQRKNYAGIGYTYDATRDAFIPPQPFPSWVLNENTCLWNAPVPMPTDGQLYFWDEPTTTWVAQQ